MDPDEFGNGLLAMLDRMQPTGDSMTVRECGPTHYACACQLERLDRLETEVERLRRIAQEARAIVEAYDNIADTGEDWTGPLIVGPLRAALAAHETHGYR